MIIFLLISYVVYLAATIIIAIRLGLPRKESGINVVLTTLGCILYASILLDHPLDTNKFVGWIITSLLH